MAADEGISHFVGRHGACEAVVSVLERRPRDLQLQASGVKAVRALAHCGGRNVDVLTAVRGPKAVARAQGLFLRDREVQLACLGAAEALCRGRRRANIAAFVNAGSLTLLEGAVNQFADDVEVVTQGLRALVEILTGANAVVTHADAPAEETIDKWCNHCVPKSAVQPSSLPALQPVGGDNQRRISGTPTVERLAVEPTPQATEIARAVTTVLAAMEHNPCREICLSSFDALARLLVLEKDGDDVDIKTIVDDDLLQVGIGTNAARTADGGLDSTAIKKGLLQWTKVRYSVKRAIKLHHRDDAELTSKGRNILALVAVRRGRALPQ